MKGDGPSFNQLRGRLGQPSRPTPTEDQGASTPPILRNEASWKMRIYARKMRNVNMLRRLQKNDNWLRFPGNEGTSVDDRRTDMDLHGRYTDADAMAWGIFELVKASGCLKGCWCEERPFDKLRMMGRGRGGCDRKYTGAGNLFLLFVGEDAFDAGVGGEAEEGDGDEEGVGEPGVDEGEGDGEEVERGREFDLPVVADGGGEEGVGALLFDDGGLQNVVGDGGHEEDEAVDGGGYLPEMIFADPGGGEREKREPEEEMEVRPEDAAADAFGGLEEVVMVVPVDADVDETEDVAEEDGQERFQGGEVGGVRDFQFQHHDGDDDREDAVAEGFEPGGFHGAGAGCPKATAFAERKVVAGRRSWTERGKLTSREGVLLVA